jgi:hypothetical protein
MPRVKNHLLIWPYYILIFVGLVIPSDGNHGALSLKSLAFLLTSFGLGLFVILKQKISVYQLRLVSFFLFSLVFLFSWLFISMARNQTTSMAQWDQFKLFLITIVFPLLTIYMVKENVILPQKVFKFAIYSSFFYIFVKILVVALYLLNFINLWNFLNAWGIRFMSMNIYGGLDRIQTSVDIVTPFFVFFILQSHRLGIIFKPAFKSIYLILSFCSTFLSFSRYLVFIYAVSGFLYFITLDLKKIVKSILAMFCICFLFYLVIGPDKINKIIERRIFSYENFKSDEARSSQIHSLLFEHEQVPLIGKGLGGYAQNNIRDRTLLHSYEVQWVAFLMQFGMVGLSIILIPFTLIFCRIWGKSISITRGAFCCLFFLWMLSGFMNPFLISLTSGIMYALFFLSADMLRTVLEKKDKEAHIICKELLKNPASL